MLVQRTTSTVSSAVPSSPSALEVDTRTADALTVKWTVPNSETFTGYKVTVIEGDNVKTETPTKDATSVTITGLTAGTEYSVAVVTVNGQDESSILTETYSTCEQYFVYMITVHLLIVLIYMCVY